MMGEVREVFLEEVTSGREGASSEVRIAGVRAPCRYERHEGAQIWDYIIDQANL